MLCLASLFDTFSQSVGQASKSSSGRATAQVFVAVVVACYLAVILRRRLR